MITKIPIESLTSDLVKQIIIHPTISHLKMKANGKRIFEYESTDKLPKLYYIQEGDHAYSIHALNSDLQRAELIKAIEPKPVPPVPPIPPTPTERESDSYDYIHDEASWNESYENGVLKKYYEKYPFEDLWNPVENRAANLNDRVYEAVEYEDAEGTSVIGEAELQAQWYSDTVQKLIDRDTQEEYFIPFDPEKGVIYELFMDAEMTESANIFVKLNEISYPDCIHCWEGAVKAPGAAYPWIAPYIEEEITAKIRFEYEGKEPVMPWGDKTFHDGSWGCAAVANEFNDPSFKVEECGGENVFDINKFKMILIIE